MGGAIPPFYENKTNKMEFHMSNIVGNKKIFHQARISGDLKEHIRVLATIEGKSISDVTEEAF